MRADIAVVTGATGYIASEIVAQLLHKGYEVRATVRDVSKIGRIRHLKRLAEAFAGGLSFHEAELGNTGSFHKIVEGATFVFHCAAEVDVDSFPRDAAGRRRLVDRAVDSQLDIIRACAANKDTVKRVVITSSTAAMKPFSAVRHQPWSEEDWNHSSLTDDGLENHTYLSVKTLTEMKSYELATKLGVSLSSIVPSFVVGPIISDNLGFSPKAVKMWLENGGESMWLATAVDVRDVARAHIMAAEKANGEGRFLVARSHPLPPSDVVETLRQFLPEYKIDEENHSRRGFYNPDFQIYDTTKVQELGLIFTDIRESANDMILSMLKKNMLQLEPVIAEPPQAATMEPNVFIAAA